MITRPMVAIAQSSATHGEISFSIRFVVPFVACITTYPFPVCQDAADHAPAVHAVELHAVAGDSAADDDKGVVAVMVRRGPPTRPSDGPRALGSDFW